MTAAIKALFIGAFIVVIALTGATLWKIAKPNDEVAKQVASLDSRIAATNATLGKVQSAVSAGGVEEKLAKLNAEVEKTNAALAKVQTAASNSAGIDDKLAALAAKIDKTNAALADMQKGELLKTVADKLDALNAGLKATDASLASVTKAIPQSGLDSKLDAIAGKQGDLNTKLEALGTKQSDLDGKIAALDTSLKSANASLDTIKKTAPNENLSAQLDAVGAQVKSLNDVVAALKKTSAGANADQSAALTEAVGDLKKNIDSASALSSKLADQAAKLEDAAKAAAKPTPPELMVVYVHLPNEQQMPQATNTVTPLSVHFEHIGGTKDNGQAKAMISKLKDIIKGRKTCTISVVGYADTLGSDNVNLDISKKRAANVAAELKAAFAGTGVQINQAAWGERRLQDWTPDRTPSLANRRVDIAVECKG